MFCSKCGKKLNYAAIICNECLQGKAPCIDENSGAQEVGDNFYTDLNLLEKDGGIVAESMAERSTDALVSFDRESHENPKSEERDVPKPRGSRAVGLGSAIASAALAYPGLLYGIYGLLFSWIMFIMYYGADSALEYVEYIPFGVFGVIFAISGLILTVVGLVKGIKSIKVFKRSSPKPIATLILGLLGLDFSITFLVSFVFSAWTMAVLAFIMSFAQ